MARCEKNRAGFSHVCVRVLSKIKISHSNIIPIYYCGAAQDGRGGSNRLRHILSMADINLAQIGANGATWLRYNLRS